MRVVYELMTKILCLVWPLSDEYEKVLSASGFESSLSRRCRGYRRGRGREYGRIIIILEGRRVEESWSGVEEQEGMGSGAHRNRNSA